jgi:hypothetical protein
MHKNGRNATMQMNYCAFYQISSIKIERGPPGAGFLKSHHFQIIDDIKMIPSVTKPMPLIKPGQSFHL